jgi:hypothetical protein
MGMSSWLAQRDSQYILQRGLNLLRRYRLSPTLAMSRVERIVNVLSEYGCAPTFPTPGVVVKSRPEYFRKLQERDVEFSVHSYYHVDLKARPPDEAKKQLFRAADIFRKHGLEVHGFRCPYLSWSDALLDILPEGSFGYSSNQAVRWNVFTESITRRQEVNFGIINGLYVPQSSDEKVCVPWRQANLVEIPVCVPDDLQLYDGLQIGIEAMIKVWTRVLHRTHQRGELFNLMFHPELVEVCEQIFPALLQEAKNLEPAVWVARLRDISAWWYEKEEFKVEMTSTESGLQLDIHCSPRGTVLSRGLALSGEAWAGNYKLVEERRVNLADGIRPFVGLSDLASSDTLRFLEEQGYILDLSDQAPQCSVYLDLETLESLNSEVALVEYIEKTDAPLLRFWRWPNGCKSALCISGDLDALTLWDYMTRLYAH